MRKPIMRSVLTAAVLLTTSIVVPTSALARHAASQIVTLMADKAGAGASGSLQIADAGKLKKLHFTVQGLKPGTYTLWFVNMKPKMDMEGIGKAPHTLAIKNGKADVTVSVTRSQLKKWQMVEIANHPTGDPMDMKKMEIVLKAELPR